MRHAAVLLAAAALAGCSGLARDEGVSGFAPDTQASVIAAQAVNPWPRKAYDKTWPADGRRALAAWKKLLAGQGGTDAAAAAASTTAE